MPTNIQVVFDCADPDRLATFWAEALGYVKQPPPPGFDSWPAFLRSIGETDADMDRASAVVDPEGIRPRVYFQRVPEGKVAKNRCHLDLNVGGGRETPAEERRRRVEAEAERLVGLGASIRRPVDENGEFWITMHDPEGNEFCLQ